MAALVYHPAYDPYGSVLRSLQYLGALDSPVIGEQLRIFDFLLLFPEFISSFRLTTQLRSRLKKIEYRARFRYEERPPALRLFGEMEPSFEAALQTLKAKGLIRLADPDTEAFYLDRDTVPEPLSALAEKRSASMKSLLDYLVELNASFPFFGPNGLKARSGLLEFRYDVI